MGTDRRDRSALERGRSGKNVPEHSGKNILGLSQSQILVRFIPAKLSLWATGFPYDSLLTRVLSLSSHSPSLTCSFSCSHVTHRAAGQSRSLADRGPPPTRLPTCAVHHSQRRACKHAHCVWRAPVYFPVILPVSTVSNFLLSPANSSPCFSIITSSWRPCFPSH